MCGERMAECYATFLEGLALILAEKVWIGTAPDYHPASNYHIRHQSAQADEFFPFLISPWWNKDASSLVAERLHCSPLFFALYRRLRSEENKRLLPHLATGRAIQKKMPRLVVLTFILFLQCCLAAKGICLPVYEPGTGEKVEQTGGWWYLVFGTPIDSQKEESILDWI